MVMTSWLALQLLLDAHSLKSYLLDLPSVGAAVAKKAPSPYVRVCVCMCDRVRTGEGVSEGVCT